jgi:aspartyl/asparaginyl beta-hydroxylase (cupin superfamily)
MKSTSQFKAASHKDTMHSSFHGYLHISYPELVDKLGPPHDRTQEGEWRSGDEKTRAEWAFKSTNKKRPMVLTIYDYKEYRPISKVNQWHVGIKGDAHLVDLLFKQKGLHPEAFEIRKKCR